MKRLKDLIASLDAEITGPTDIEIRDVVFDSRHVKRGALFVALRGVHQDGHDYVTTAVAQGAAAVLVEKPVLDRSATVVRVRDTLQALAHVALRFWDRPSQKLRIVGITGTNGKTTTSYLIESIFQVAGFPTAVLGTINYRYNDQVLPAPNTTPFSSELQRFLHQAVAQGAQACVMEVSSHALELGRVQGVDFDVAVFTNLTQDHLDFHHTLDSYGLAKRRLFEALDPASPKTYPKCAVINLDDAWGERMASASRVPIWSYRLHGSADVSAKHVECTAQESRFALQAPGGVFPVHLSLLGEYNVLNALAAAAVGFSQGISSETIIQGLEKVSGVPGRMERVHVGQPFTVVVDYAHTEDALRQVLNALRRLKPHRLITVFGCGGDRDRTKRPLMGETAAALSDMVFVTSDNPRSEDPGKITLDIEVGIRRVRPDRYQIILDREQAIACALSQAQPDDIVLVAGKGHENYQILGDKTIPFDDREVVRRLLAVRPASS